MIRRFLSSMGGASSKGGSAQSMRLVEELIQQHKVVVFSKTYCPYCNKAKGVLNSIGAPFQAVELDQRPDGGDIQASLKALTGRSTVPNVFIGGTTVGGGDDVARLYQTGELKTKLRSAGVL